MNKLIVLLAFVQVSCSIAYGQEKLKKDTATVNALLQESKSLIASDSAKAIDLAMQAKEMATQLSFPKGEAYALKNIGMVYYMKGQYVETLDYWSQSLQIFETIGDDAGKANMLSNIGAIYFNQGADVKALEYTLKSLELAEKTGDTLRMITALINIGSTYHNKKDPRALDYLLQAIPLFKNNNHMAEFVVITGDIGEIYFDNNNDSKALEYFQKSIDAAGGDIPASFSTNGIGKVYLREGKFDKALEYHKKALEIAKKFDDNLQVVRSLRGIADVYMKKEDIGVAIGYYRQAKEIAEKMDDVKVELKDLYQEMALAYSKNKNFTEAFTYQTLYADIKDSIYDNESKKKLNQLQFDFELSKKQSEIVLKEAKIKSEKQARMGVTVGLGLLLILAFIIYRNYLQKAKVNKILDKQKDQIEDLLLNILPAEVAKELQHDGQATPRFYERVSVLFTDFKSFTTIADKLSPQEVVAELNDCFVAFDEIVEKYGLEKIKTIGDSYMCAGGIPVPNEEHPVNMTLAGMEIRDHMRKRNEQRLAAGLPPWELRIGIHVGPLVAGVVGKKKYAYDIWGSTVNIASRMESNGEAGQINVSSDTYEIIKDRFECTYRGKIYAKNVGEVDMYFVTAEKVSSIRIIEKGQESPDVSKVKINS